MVDGESGILSVYPHNDPNRPRHEPTKRRVSWPNGSIATVFSSIEYDQLRGPQHHLAWTDELCAFRYPQAAWDQLMFGLRLGPHPQVVVTTTPKPIPLLKSLLARERTEKNPSGDVAVTRGSTYDNRPNLAPSFFAEIISKYEGTRLGQQELHAQLLDDAEGALWTRDMLERNRETKAPGLARIVVAVDPPAKSKAGSAECGIVVAGVDEEGVGHVVDDLSRQASPDEWGRAVVLAYDKHGADRVVAEVNHGGEMVEYVIRTAAEGLHRERRRPSAEVSFRAVHASRGKATRAEPVAALFEQGRVKMTGFFAELEGQLCAWEPLSGAESPDRMDAMVWGLTDLMLDIAPQPRAWTL